MFRIGYRTLKTAVGTAIAIMIAQFFEIDNYASAGIITILCIQNTKRKSIRASWSRFAACVLAMVFSAVFFEVIAYHPLVIGLMILFFIPTTVILNIKEGIVTSSVIILHIFMNGQITVDSILNELWIIVIGVGIALIMNLYMPSVESKLVYLQEKIESNFYEIFTQIAAYLRDENSSWDGKEITETDKLLSEAKTLAFQDVENHFMRNENHYYLYFTMRQKQFELVERMLPLISSLSSSVEQREMIASFVEDLSDHIHGGNTAILYLKKLFDLKLKFEEMEMPKTREEFETRAALYQFIREMEEYLQLKQSFRGLPDPDKK
ncbi:aromatic acid exporter family protein [Jeotgalibacillus sp. S-D1]|uniref:aromatic acid exporter family protein n=1 Tax=Jeotgalibacillus sp. S-D1 TaxID=2552189 RepID=UPI0010596A79|nr:aromatic acid exporter family protein [Jeotgalibacillus sp. S-D1]TDL34652.1 aromatic acid exporter family protein [Jeotgalibacillus sp. S-D1]